MIDRLLAMLRSAVTRAKVTTGAVNGRTIVQITGLAGETKQSVEVLHPFGWFGNPSAGADIVVLQVMGTRDHLVALGGDPLAQNIACPQGEFGAKHAMGAFFHFTNDGKITVQDPSGSQLIMQNNGTVWVKGTLMVTGDIVDNCQTQTESMAGQRAVYNAHDHTVTGVQTGLGTVTTQVPNQQEV